MEEKKYISVTTENCNNRNEESRQNAKKNPAAKEKKI